MPGSGIVDIGSVPPERNGIEGDVVPKLGWWGRLKARGKNVFANTLQLIGIGLERVAETAVFTGGVGFFVGPPLEQMWGSLREENIAYSVTVSGSAHLTPNSSLILPKADFSQLVFTDIPIANQSIPFDMPYPSGIFYASTLLVSLGILGIGASRCIQSYGLSLQNADESTSYSSELISLAKRRTKQLAAADVLFLAGSRVTALYSIATFNMTRTLANVAGILDNFSTYSQQSAHYTNSDHRGLVQAILINFNIHTVVGLDDLREAATRGSYAVDNYYTPLAYLCAVISLVLGFAKLKTSQHLAHYEKLLQRYECEMKYQDLNRRALSDRQLSVVVVDEEDSDSLSASIPRAPQSLAMIPVVSQLRGSERAPAQLSLPPALSLFAPPLPEKASSPSRSLSVEFDSGVRSGASLTQ